jgi:hypothetical protein
MAFIIPILYLSLNSGCVRAECNNVRPVFVVSVKSFILDQHPFAADLIYSYSLFGFPLVRGTKSFAVCVCKFCRHLVVQKIFLSFAATDRAAPLSIGNVAMCIWVVENIVASAYVSFVLSMNLDWKYSLH